MFGKGGCYKEVLAFDTCSKPIYRRFNLKRVSNRIVNFFTPEKPHWIPNIDVFIAPSGELVVCVELSGMQRGDFEIITEGTKLRISGRRPSSGLATAHAVLVHEINAGPFESTLEMPAGFDLARASSVFKNGALRITVPPGSKLS